MYSFIKYMAAFALVGSSSAVAASIEVTFPKLFFSYSWLYDETVCGAEAKSEWSIEARAREKEFSEIWEHDAPQFLSELSDYFGRGMSRKELTATLSVCPNSWNYSDPLVFRALPFLKSFMDERPTWPNFAFSNVVLHELLHGWLVENFSFSTPLLIKYQSEPMRVRSHLHLMAVQKFIYQKIGRDDLLHWIDQKYSGMEKAYSRAWQIVNLIEGHEPFIAELKAQMNP